MPLFSSPQSDKVNRQPTSEPLSTNAQSSLSNKPAQITSSNVLELQRTIGNKAVQRRIAVQRQVVPSNQAPVVQTVRSGEEIDSLVNLNIARHHLENLSDVDFKAVQDLSAKVKAGSKHEELVSSDEYKTLQTSHEKLGDDQGKNRAPVILAGLFKGQGRLDELNPSQKASAMVYDAMSPTYKATKADETTMKGNRSNPTYSSLTTVTAAKTTIENATKEREGWLGKGPQDKDHNPELFKGMSKETVEASNEGLTPMEKAAIYDYAATGFLGDGIASTAKTLDPKNLPQQINKLKLARSALNKLPVYAGKTWRGEKEGRRKMFVKGSTVGFDKFVSSSTARDTSFIRDQPLLLQFESIKTGRDIRLINPRSTEYEVLFPQGSRFFVKDVQKDAKENKTIITLEEV